TSNLVDAEKGRERGKPPALNPYLREKTKDTRRVSFVGRNKAFSIKVSFPCCLAPPSSGIRSQRTFSIKASFPCCLPSASSGIEPPTSRKREVVALRLEKRGL
ncbi:MAG: hypothetical protein MJ096_05540, partial [Clostridia bacterium]|nr:hypothetical protein [Clostridia bacterium]